ncbi:MAG: hypothetical protein HKN56_11175 [Gammaproteobacteria bacterium]|nr:hypothetical protein [Gammaproteobacteria bacterium]
MDDTQLGAIFSLGRSGSTWLGALINSHPEVAYRFEPFSRLRAQKDFQAFDARLKNELSGSISTSEIIRLMLPAHPLVDKPPFFDKAHALGFAKNQAWIASRVLRMPSAFAHLYTPKNPRHLVFKEVGYGIPLAGLDPEVFGSIPAIYLVRHPCGNVLSSLTGQNKGLMADWHMENIGQFLSENSPALFAKYPDVATMSELKKLAVLWLYAVEDAARLAGRYPNILFVSYDELCTSPLQVTKKVFAHLKIPWHSQTEEFIDSCLSLDENESKNKALFSRKYFNVYRNPVTAHSKWKQKISIEDKDAILRIVSQSPIYKRFFE